MLLTVAEFKRVVDSELPSLVEELRDLTGRHGDAEATAWRSSLPKLAKMLTHPTLDELHLHFARREHHVSLEYQLPGASAWCDVVLLGRSESGPAAVIIELKDWDTRLDRPGAWEGLIERRGAQELHPSDQVRGYVHYCQRFHSAVLQQAAHVHGCVLFTSAFVTTPYMTAPNDRLSREVPIFTTSAEDASGASPRDLSDRLQESDALFAKAFATGNYQQDRSFMAQIGAEILGTETGAFELLDNQRQALALCQARINHLLANRSTTRRKVVLVEGPPGSGKSAVAARLWASLVTEPELPDGNVVLVTTSMSQGSNWSHLIDRVTGDRVGRGVARKATSFTPLTTNRLSQLRRAFGNDTLFRDAANWRDHMRQLQSMGNLVNYQPGSEDDACLVALVDEAHALINPEREHGVGQYGFVTGLGPQAWQIIRSSRVSVFFIDPQQSFRARENTSIADILQWASELDADVESVSLAGAQFRCAGSAEYVSWVEALLAGSPVEVNRVHAGTWQSQDKSTSEVAMGENIIPFPNPKQTAPDLRSAYPVLRAAENIARYAVVGPRRSSFDFRVYDNPFELEAALRDASPCHTVRLLSSYSRPWKTDGATNPHLIAAERQDFCESMLIDGSVRVWSKPWNVVPNGDYTPYVQARPGTAMASDPLCEVGCPYAVRGFDFHYVGLVWLNDLVWREDRWVVQVAHVHESGIRLITQRAAQEGLFAPAGANGALLMEKVAQAYRILLTRAIHGLFVWIADEETRLHVRRSLEPAGNFP